MFLVCFIYTCRLQQQQQEAFPVAMFTHRQVHAVPIIALSAPCYIVVIIPSYAFPAPVILLFI